MSGSLPGVLESILQVTATPAVKPWSGVTL